MAQFTKVNGTTQPVFAIDVGNGSIAGTANVAANGSVQMAGPKLDFFTATANGALTTTQVAAGVQAIQQLATIHIYEYTDAANDTLAFAVYPTGAWTTAGLVAALEDAGWANAVTVAASATFTN